MGRCGWGTGLALILAVLGASCGGTGGGGSADSGNQFIFTARGRLGLAVQTVSATAQQTASAQSALDPKRLLLTATLLDPQGVPFRNTLVTFTADFPDATFIPGNDNTGSARTDDNGQASITLVAGLTLGKMRVVAEAPSALNISTGITVTLTEQGFVSLGSLGIVPSSVTFVNPAPHPPGGPADFTFQATGGNPPYRFSNSNPNVGKIETVGVAGSLGFYTLTGPLPVEEDETRTDTVVVQDAGGNRATATVSVIFADCLLQADGEDVTVLGLPGRNFQVNVADGVPPFTATPSFPNSVNVDIVVLDQRGNIIPGAVCDKAGENCAIRFSLSDPVRVVDPGTILIRDSRGCTATVTYHVTPVAGPTVTTIVLEANPFSINGITGGTSAITATVLDENNQPIPNISVLFTDDHARTTINPLTATTNSSGRAFSTLQVPSLTPSGVVRVTGSALEVSGFVDVTIVAQGGPAGSPANIAVDLFADRSGDNNDGTCTTILSALVVNAKGNPVDDGTRVDFAASLATTTTGGSAAVSVTSPTFTNQLPPCDISTYERDSGLEVTPQPGDALACLKYPRSASGGTTTITTTAGGLSPQSFTVTLPPCPFAPPGELAIFPPSTTLAPGESRTFIIVGGIPPYNIAVSGGTADTNQVTASGGSFTYTAGTQTGNFTIFAIDTAGTQDEATVTINATSAEVATIILGATPPSVNGVTGGTSTITASVFNESNQPIQGISVLFETDTGTVSPLTATTNASGQASTILTIATGTPAGVAEVMASAGGESDSINVDIVTTSSGPAGPPADIFVDQFADRSGDNNDGTCTTILSALVVDAEGNPVNDGTQVGWQVGPLALCGASASSSVTTPSFTNQAPPCNVDPYQADTGIDVTPQPGDALTCLKYPQSGSGSLVFITATVTGTNPEVSALCTMITLPPCPPPNPNNPTAVCGNGIQEAGELCDGPVIGTDCNDLPGFSGGVLTCAANCTFNTSLCTP